MRTWLQRIRVGFMSGIEIDGFPERFSRFFTAGDSMCRFFLTMYRTPQRTISNKWMPGSRNQCKWQADLAITNRG
jgi:hypothetical protein